MQAIFCAYLTILAFQCAFISENVLVMAIQRNDDAVAAASEDVANEVKIFIVLSTFWRYLFHHRWRGSVNL
uniref:Secreted protein n=1 Tax=Romanomermis culicivorax TaxID=13658 RepID=A0A915I3C0_ROMCU